MVYCTSCGIELPEGAMFCPKCGRSSNAAPVERMDESVEAIREGLQTAGEEIEKAFSPAAQEIKKAFSTVGEETVQKEQFKVSGNELVEKVKALIHEGNVRRIIVKDEEDRIVLEIPLTAGVIGTVLAPILAAVAALAALAMSYTIVVERKQEE